MNRVWAPGLAVLLAATALGEGQAMRRTWSSGYPGYRPGQQSDELTIEEQRKLGLSEEQILKIAAKRRELEKKRQELDNQLTAAREAASAATAQVTKLSQEIRDLTSDGLKAIYKEVMSEDQLKAYERQKLLEEAKRWLQRYRWLNLSEAQTEDISGLLVPVLQKYSKVGDEQKAARERLAELRRAEKLDIKAIEEAEKSVAELSTRNMWRERDEELREKMRAGLMPDQLEKIDRAYRPRR